MYYKYVVTYTHDASDICGQAESWIAWPCDSPTACPSQLERLATSSVSLILIESLITVSL